MGLFVGIGLPTKAAPFQFTFTKFMFWTHLTKLFPISKWTSLASECNNVYLHDLISFIIIFFILYEISDLNSTICFEHLDSFSTPSTSKHRQLDYQRRTCTSDFGLHRILQNQILRQQQHAMKSQTFCLAFPK